MVLKAPPSLVTVIIVFAGVLSNTASEMGYVVLVPLAAVVFYSLGRHPLAGLAAAFAGVSGGYSANLLLGTVDPLLAGLAQEAAHILDPELRPVPIGIGASEDPRHEQSQPDSTASIRANTSPREAPGSSASHPPTCTRRSSRTTR